MIHALVLAFALQERDPALETNDKAEFHISAAELAEGTEEGKAAAHYHWERVLDCCSASPADRLRARQAITRLREAVPASKDPKRQNKWRVLGVLFGGVNWKSEVNQRLAARYRVSNAVAKGVKKGFDAFCGRVDEISRGHMRVEPKFIALDDDAKNLTEYGRGVYMYPENYELSRAAPKVKDGEYDLVIVYLVSNEPLPWEREAYRWPDPWHGATYVNMTLPDASVAANSETGDLELGVFAGQIRNSVVNRAGFAEALFPSDSTEDDRTKEVRCYERKSKNPMEYPLHLLDQHMTSFMWREVATAQPPGPFIRSWLVSAPFDNADDKGYDKGFVEESNAGLTLKEWQPMAAKGDFLDLKSKFRLLRGSLAYAATYVYAKKKSWIRIAFGPHATAKVIWDGQPVYTLHRHRDGYPDQFTVRVLAEEGRHLLLFKVENDTQGYTNDWGLFARVIDSSAPARVVEVSPVRK